MSRAQRMTKEFLTVREHCAIVAACDAKHVPFLVNALLSMQACFPDYPRVIIYDIGLAPLHRMELRKFDRVEVRAVPPFVEHWRLNWSWKLHALTQPTARWVLYLDLANFVVLRSLAPLFLSIRRHGYLVVSNGQRLGDITPSSYWAVHDLLAEAYKNVRTFGAGIIGFDRQGLAFAAIEQAAACMMLGLNLGRSADEPNRKYRPNTVRDCSMFRADQTLLNLAFRQNFGHSLQVRRTGRYGGRGGRSDHVGQFLWYSRLSRDSLVYLFKQAGSDRVRAGASAPATATPVNSLNWVRWLNRLTWSVQLGALYAWRAAWLKLNVK